MMKNNIAQMYQYYNHLIFQQGGAVMQQQPQLMFEGPAVRLGDPDLFERAMMRRQEFSQETGQVRTRPSLGSQGTSEKPRAQSPASADGAAARSRSRSAARSTENLLVSLDSCPPIANDSVAGEVLQVERSLSMRLDQRPSLLSRLGLSKASREDEILSDRTHPVRSASFLKRQNPRIKHRYSTK